MRNTVTQEQIEEIIKGGTLITGKIGRKTTVLCLVLQNGFEITATSACVDPENYDLAIGEEVCKKKIADRLWELEGYRLQDELAHAT